MKWKIADYMAVFALVFVLLTVVVFTGCAMFQRPPSYILTETESYYFIPPNTPFKARLVKDGPLVEVQRVQPTWAVDAGYLAKLQEAANAVTLVVPE